MAAALFSLARFVQLVSALLIPRHSLISVQLRMRIVAVLQKESGKRFDVDRQLFPDLS